MAFEEALAKRLLDDAEIATLVGSRVEWEEREQSGGLPAILLELVSDPRPVNLDGFVGLRETRVTITCFASGAKAARNLRERVIAVLAPPAALLDVQFSRSFFELVRAGVQRGGVAPVHKGMIDALIWHSPREATN